MSKLSKSKPPIQVATAAAKQYLGIRQPVRLITTKTMMVFIVGSLQNLYKYVGTLYNLPKTI